MNKAEIMNKIGGTFHKVGFSIKKHSPEILVTAGVIGTVTSAVLACKATLKVNDILEEHKETMDKIHSVETSEKYTESDKKKDTTIVYAQTAVKLGKLYAPAVTLGVLSIGSIITSNNILRKRNAALAAAYTAIDTSFKEYRNRVVDRFGKDVDHQLRYNLVREEIEETETNEKGKEKTVKKTVDVADPDYVSDYAVYFTSANPNFKRDPYYNEMFLRSQMAYANDYLRAHGWLSLNDIYSFLDMPKTKAGMVVGWVYDTKNPTGDNNVEFDVKKVKIKSTIGEGYEDAYLIDFNVDGNIYNQLA